MSFLQNLLAGQDEPFQVYKKGGRPYIFFRQSGAEDEDAPIRAKNVAGFLIFSPKVYRMSDGELSGRPIEEPPKRARALTIALLAPDNGDNRGLLNYLRRQESLFTCHLVSKTELPLAVQMKLKKGGHSHDRSTSLLAEEMMRNDNMMSAILVAASRIKAERTLVAPVVEFDGPGLPKTVAFLKEKGFITETSSAALRIILERLKDAGRDVDIEALKTELEPVFRTNPTAKRNSPHEPPAH